MMGFSSDAGKPENKEPLLRPNVDGWAFLNVGPAMGCSGRSECSGSEFFFIRKKCWDGIGLAAVYGRLGSSS